jgi:TRAP-type uncharacterized transport system fused permease subunit
VAGVTIPAKPEVLDDRAAVPDESAERLLEKFEPEMATRRLGGRVRILAAVLAVSLALYGLYWVVAVVDTRVYRTSFLLVTLALGFLLYSARRARPRHSPSPLDWALVGLTIIAFGWPLLDGAGFSHRAATPTNVDLALGVAAILLVLEAVRRTSGPVLPVTAALFILYAYLGPLLDLVGLSAIGHRGYYADRLVGMLYMTLDGIFGVPLDVGARVLGRGAILH